MSLPVGGLQESEVGGRPAHRRRNVRCGTHQCSGLPQEENENCGRSDGVGQGPEFQEMPGRNHPGGAWKTARTGRGRPGGRDPRLGKAH
eukprot:14089059-Heterocapsa_arctica.AAC.1